MSRGASSGGFGSANQVERRITDLERRYRELTMGADGSGNITGLSVGAVSLSTTPATSTVKTDANVTASSTIIPVPSNIGAWSLDAGVSAITPGNGSITITHTASSLGRLFRYLVINHT